MRITTEELKKIIKEELEASGADGQSRAIERLAELVEEAYFEGWSDAAGFGVDAFRRGWRDNGWERSTAKAEVENIIG